MQIRTFSILAGTTACNARCPFCVSKMTVASGVDAAPQPVHWRNFHKACRLALMGGATTAMLTGKGEPTLFPEQITDYLAALQQHDVPLVELQTNGIRLMDDPRAEEWLARWYELGLSTVAVSVVHWEPEPNRQVYLPQRPAYIDLPGLIAKLHRHGLSVRLAAIFLRGWIDTPEELQGLADFCREQGVEQLVARPVARPSVRHDDGGVSAWTAAHSLSDAEVDAIHDYVQREGKPLMRLLHGARVYDLAGQSVCISDCLSLEPETESIRQLIFFPDGHLRYDWQYAGATLL